MATESLYSSNFCARLPPSLKVSNIFHASQNWRKCFSIDILHDHVWVLLTPHDSGIETVCPVGSVTVCPGECTQSAGLQQFAKLIPGMMISGLGTPGTVQTFVVPSSWGPVLPQIGPWAKAKVVKASVTKVKDFIVVCGWVGVWIYLRCRSFYNMCGKCERNIYL